MNKTYIYISLIVLLVIVAGYFTYNKFIKNSAKLVREAKKYLGLKEIPQNTGFYNPEFEDKMKKAGWKYGYEWCMLFVEMVVRQTLKGKKRKLAAKLISPSTQQTFINIKNDKSGLFSIVKKPKPGDIVIYQSKTQSYKGHAAIIEAVNKNNFKTIGGNENNKVSNLTRSYNGTSGMRIRGFIRLNT